MRRLSLSRSSSKIVGPKTLNAAPKKIFTPSLCPLLSVLRLPLIHIKKAIRRHPSIRPSQSAVLSVASSA
jgi:hypothetical protein